MTRKIISVLLAALLLVGVLAGCGGTGADGGRLSVVTTIFPEYDWVMNILGDEAENADVTLLLDNGVDLHSYQPTAQDIITIAACDVFIYVGGESDAWVDDALREATNPDMIVVDLLDALGSAVKEEEIVDGMQPEEEDEDEEGPEYDEHVWLSLRNAEVLTAVIADALAEADPEHAETYRANAEGYAADLAALDGDYRETVAQGAYDTLLFGDRFPFRYLTDDYDLTYYAAFVGCSAETEASFETLVFLTEKLDELRLPAVLVTESSDQKLARTIIDSSETQSAKILTLDSMQSTTAQDVENGVTYLGVMRENLAVLKQALA